MAETKIHTALLGVRGQGAVDLDALADVLVRFSGMMLAEQSIVEADINPLLTTADGIVALDARIVLRPQGQGTEAPVAALGTLLSGVELPIAERVPPVTMRARSKEPHSAMTRTLALLALAVAAVSFSSCDKHTWKETQVLHEKYGEHAKAEGGHEGAKDARSAPAAGHEATPAAAKH